MRINLRVENAGSHMKIAVTHFAQRCVSGVKHILRMAQNLLPSSPAITAVLCCAIGATAVSGTEAHKKVYNVPGGDAATTLGLFARTSGDQIVYMVENVRGEKTRPVRGEFIALDALRQMLTGTALFAVQDESTGALVVSRKRLAPAQKEPEESERSRGPPAAAPAAPPDPPKNNQPKHTESPSVKNRNFLALIAAWLVAGPATYAQTASAPAKDETVVLSPFVVSSTLDTGYLGASTLAGTRLNTPVKDLGASIAIYTKDFLNDIGATNPSELLIYATSMEAGGAGGNFSGSTLDMTSIYTSNGGIQTNPQGASRSRGLAAPTFTRGLFASSIAMDSYNTEAVTVNRGANGILFGTGSPAGVVDTSLIQADTRRDRNTVAVRYGSNDSFRASIDLNRVLIPQKLALRIAALRDKNEFNQRPAFEDKSRIYGAVAYRPARSTALRASFESGNTKANRPLTITPFDCVSFWTANGRPSFDWSFHDDPARNPSAAAQNAGNFYPPLLANNNINQTGVVLVYNNCVIHDTKLNGIKIQESFGRVMRNMVFSNIVMDRVNGPISIRLGGWKTGSNSWAVFDDSRWEEGRISDIRFDNIRANAVVEPGNKLGMFISGAGRARPTNIYFSNMDVRFPGGGTSADAERAIPERERAYPEIFMFGVLSAYGLYLRHADGVVLHNVRFSLESEDLRPAVVCDDVKGFEHQAFSAQGNPFRK